MSTYITLVTSDTFLVPAQVLAYSLSKVSSMDISVLISEQVSDQGLSSLRQSGWFKYIYRVREIPSPFSSHVSSWTDCALTKLRIWALDLLHYQKVVYIDADCIVLANCDSIFDRLDHCQFCAAPDLFPPDKFNAGVLGIRPDSRLLGEMITRISVTESYDGGDTGFLNEMFPGWFAGDGQGRLGFGYNAQRGMYEFTKKNVRYWESFEKVIVHYSSRPKPWDRVWSELDRLWVEMYEEMKAVGDRESETEICDVAELLLGKCKDSKGLLDSFRPRKQLEGYWSESDHEWLENWSSLVPSVIECASPIPAKIHQIWLGSELPESVRGLCSKWESSALENGWEYKLWTDQDLDSITIPRNIPFDTLENVQKSDILRLLILHQFGGVYLDCDMKLVNFPQLAKIRPFHSFLIGMSNTGAIELNNAFVASAAKHSFLDLLLHFIDSQTLPSRSAKTLLSATGPGLYSQVLGEIPPSHWSSLQAFVLPRNVFYPLPNSMRNLCPQEQTLFLTPETIAMHVWHSSWSSTRIQLESAISQLFSPRNMDTKCIEKHTANIMDFLF